MDSEDSNIDNYSIAKKPRQNNIDKPEAAHHGFENCTPNFKLKTFTNQRPSPPRSLPPNLAGHKGIGQYTPQAFVGASPANTMQQQQQKFFMQQGYSDNAFRYPEMQYQGYNAAKNWHPPPDHNYANPVRALEFDQAQFPNMQPPSHQAMDIEPPQIPPNKGALERSISIKSTESERLANEQQLVAEKRSSDTPKSKILDPRLRTEASEGKQDKKSGEDDVEKISRMLKKIKKTDSTTKDTKKTFNSTEFMEVLKPFNDEQTRIIDKYSQALRAISHLSYLPKKGGIDAEQKFNTNYMMLQATVNLHAENTRHTIQELTKEIIDTSLENILRQKRQAIIESQSEVVNKDVIQEDGDTHRATRVIQVPNAEIYKYNDNLREMEDKMEKLEHLLNDQKCKLKQTDRQVAKAEMALQSHNIKNQLLLQLNSKLD